MTDGTPALPEMPRTRTSRACAVVASVIAATVALAALPGCEEFLNNLPVDPTAAEELAPEVEVIGPSLRRYPSINNLAAYYCPLVINDPIVALGCAVALGPPPPPSAMAFEFGLTMNVFNPNDFPVPALDVLVALTLFNGHHAESLGAICVSLCGTDDPYCDGAPRPGACEATQEDIFTLEDFVHRIPYLISDLASGQAQEELANSTILAGGDISVDLAFILGIDQALGVFEKTANTYVNDMLEGGSGGLTVPVMVEGTVFVRLPVLGRLGIPFGPIETDWRI